MASLAFTAQTALATLALAVALLCVASGNLHGDPSVGSDMAHVPDLFSAATTPPRFLALCALAEADAATCVIWSAARGEGMQEATDKLYSEAYLTLLLHTVSSHFISPRLAVEPASCCVTQTSRPSPRRSS